MPKKSMGGKRKRSADDSAGKPAKKAKKEERVDAASLSDGTNHNARLCKQLLEYAEICRSKISEDRVNVFRARGTKAAAEAIALVSSRATTHHDFKCSSPSMRLETACPSLVFAGYDTILIDCSNTTA